MKRTLKRSYLSYALALISALPTASFAGLAHIEGSFMTEDVNKEFILKSSEGLTDPMMASSLIGDYIKRLFPNRDVKLKEGDITTDDLANRIAGAAYCFKIDPFVFAGLIHKESISFNQHALSPTGAVGLTQFTTIGTQEVNDQLGLRGSSMARAEASDYFNEVLTGPCLEVAGGFKTMGAQYRPLWDQEAVAKYTDGTRSQATAMTRILDDHPEMAIVYGAILLKVGLSSVEGGYRTGCMKHKSKVLTLKEKFREVLMTYNGDNCVIQLDYQRGIIDDFYGKISGKKAE